MVTHELKYHHGRTGRHNKQKSYHILPLVGPLHARYDRELWGESFSNEVNFSTVMKKIRV